ncbi:PaaI family thioesterase [Desulforamulus aquiferis]|uniref:PaaI family thioesterase n=1 Tax=Desulforamulus aquiferis TaxID=1397668 RepID=A0AAW7ZA04_9FIRM|nr:PaaI family thioesterase [Desulforamulus aquiferis]MDO7785924.1 PaaI family thioesterase [Desulforamulus aquiferis]
MSEQVIKFFEQDRFAAYIGLKLIKAEPGIAEVELEINEHHYNAVNMIQGGVIFTLADFAFAAASNAGGQVTVGINANVTYLKATKGKVLFAEAKEISASKKITNYVVHVFDEMKELIASLSFTGYKKGSNIEF